MNLKIAITSLICGAQILVCAPVFAAPISSASQMVPAPRKIAQADIDAASAAGLETVYKFKKHSGSRTKSRSGAKHGKRGRGKRHFASANTETAPAASTTETGSCCAGSPM